MHYISSKQMPLYTENQTRVVFFFLDVVGELTGR